MGVPLGLCGTFLVRLWSQWMASMRPSGAPRVPTRRPPTVSYQGLLVRMISMGALSAPLGHSFGPLLETPLAVSRALQWPLWGWGRDPEKAQEGPQRAHNQRPPTMSYHWPVVLYRWGPFWGTSPEPFGVSLGALLGSSGDVLGHLWGPSEGPQLGQRHHTGGCWYDVGCLRRPFSGPSWMPLHPHIGPLLSLCGARLCRLWGQRRA